MTSCLQTLSARIVILPNIVGTRLSTKLSVARFGFTVKLLNAASKGAMPAIYCDKIVSPPPLHAWLGLNSLFLAGGLIGMIQPGLSAVLHNLTTLGVSLNAMRPTLGGR